jgi:glycosyltransferase involved in cell wall biosynthesis
MTKKRVLVGSPVYQKPEILQRFLNSLKNLNRNTVSIDYMFVDDNIDDNSKELLSSFARECSNVHIIKGNETGEYTCDDETHYWNDALMLKVGNYKNTIIDYALEKNYDYLFFIDSDLVIHQNLIEHLKLLNKDIVSEIFWCSWHTGAPKLPNVWLYNGYDFYPRDLDKGLDKSEERVFREKFLNKLSIPGVYEVGGLGACTLISQKALEIGANFKPIKNITIPGEDRFFCIRAIVLGLDLFVDTHYPAYHIYRDEDLSGVNQYVEFCKAENDFKRSYKERGNKITLSMVVKNEEGRYLSTMLKSLCKHIDEAVIVDDRSTDNTVEICKEILKDIPLHIIKNEASMFSNEVSLRQKQWDETIKTNPDWILNLDADEILEDDFWGNINSLLNDIKYDGYAFRLYDMWNDTHYREDEFWNAHDSYRTFLIRYQPDFPYKYNDIPQHCGRFPMNIFSHPTANLEYRIKHLGWATEKDRQAKKERYSILDPDAIYGVRRQYDSIMDQSPTLREFII